MDHPEFRGMIIDRLNTLYELAPQGEKQLLEETMDLAKRLTNESSQTAADYVQVDCKGDDPSVMFSASVGSMTILLQYAALGMLEYRKTKGL